MTDTDARVAVDWRTDTRENTCGDPKCKGSDDHAPTDEARAKVLAMSRRK